MTRTERVLDELQQQLTKKSIQPMVPVLFQHSLPDFEDQIVSNFDHIFSVEPLKIKSPSTNAEVSLALKVLEGCCLIHRESMVLAHQFKAVQIHKFYVLDKYTPEEAVSKTSVF